MLGTLSMLNKWWLLNHISMSLNCGSQAWLHIRITWGALETRRPGMAPPLEILVSYVQDAVWGWGFYRLTRWFSCGSQDFRACFKITWRTCWTAVGWGPIPSFYVWNLKSFRQPPSFPASLMNITFLLTCYFVWFYRLGILCRLYTTGSVSYLILTTIL